MVTLKTESRKAKEWRERMERFAVSGLQVKVFCQSEGVSEAVFYRWRQRLAAEVSGGAGFIAVQAPPAAAASHPSAAPWELRLDLGGGLVLHLARH